MLTNPNYEKSKVSIHDELETVLKAAESSNYSEKDGIPSEITQNICNVVEAIFIHGLRDPFFIKGSRYAKYPEPNIWPFVSKYSEKSVIEEVNSQKQIRTEVGRGRAWIRIVMNKNSLEHYLRLLIRETKAISQFYDQQALLCDLERVEDISGLLKSLDALPIHAAVNSSFLNTWTPSPLILAGLVSGKPLKVGALKPRRRATSLCDNLEGVVGAKIDFLHSKHESTNRLLNSGKDVATSDDDNSSVYSHPSMLGSTDNIPEHVILASTPLQDIVGELPPQNIAPLIVSRRTRRSRRPRKAGEPNSVRAHSESECVNARDASFVESEPRTVSESHARISTSETLDSGIDSENRYTGPNVNFGASDKENDSTTEGQKNVIASENSLYDCECQQASTSKYEGTVPVLKDTKSDEKCDCNTIVESEELTVKHEIGHEEFSDQLPDMDVDIDIPSNDNLLDPFSNLPGQHDSMAGTSPFDEISLPEVPPSSNSLLNKAWSLPRRCMSNPERCSSARLSSSSDIDVEVGYVSFEHVLQSAMEGGNSPLKMRSNFDYSLEHVIDRDLVSDANENLWKKSAVVDVEKVIATMTTIPREVGLDEQDFHCPMCRKSIGGTFSKYGVCGIDGLYYCSDCMRAGGELPIPSRILRSWDWKLRPVSDRGRAFFEANQDSIVFHIDQHNPTLYDHVPALKIVKGLREKLQIVSMYLFNCRESIADDFRKRVWPRDHLYSDIHAYSVSDLILVRSGLLEKQIMGFLKHAIDHVMRCFLCRQKGFVCEVCESSEIIYPFQTETTRKCSHCYSVFHTTCLNKIEDCPKCIRRATYEIQQEANDLPIDLFFR